MSAHIRSAERAEIRFADGPERGRLRLWNRSGSLTERYVDLVRSAMGVPG